MNSYVRKFEAISGGKNVEVRRFAKYMKEMHGGAKKMPEFQLLKKVNFKKDLAGTHKVGEVYVEPFKLRVRFGPPRKSDEYKSSGEYVFKHSSGQVFTLYDWKRTTLYDKEAYTPAQFWALKEKVLFMIGGRESSSIHETPSLTQKKTTSYHAERFKKWLFTTLQKIPHQQSNKKEIVIFNMVFKWKKFEETPCKRPSNIEMCKFFRSKWTKTFLDHYCQMMGVWNEDVKPMYIFDKVVDIKNATIGDCAVKKDCVHLEVQADLKPYVGENTTRKVKLTNKNLTEFAKCLKDVFNFSIRSGGFLSKRFPEKEQGEFEVYKITPEDWTNNIGVSNT